jgi:hypothetical protein
MPDQRPSRRKPTIDRAPRQFRIRRDILEALDEFAEDRVCGPNVVIELALLYYFDAVSEGELGMPGPFPHR